MTLLLQAERREYTVQRVFVYYARSKERLTAAEITNIYFETGIDELDRSSLRKSVVESVRNMFRQVEPRDVAADSMSIPVADLAVHITELYVDPPENADLLVSTSFQSKEFILLICFFLNRYQNIATARYTSMRPVVVYRLHGAEYVPYDMPQLRDSSGEVIRLVFNGHHFDLLRPKEAASEMDELSAESNASADEFMLEIDSLRGKKAEPEAPAKVCLDLTYEALHEALPLACIEVLAYADEGNNSHVSGTMRGSSADEIKKGFRTILGKSKLHTNYNITS